MPIEDSASTVLGVDPRLQLAPTSKVAQGGTRGTIPSHIFAAQDRKFMERATEILTYKDRVATLKDRESARVQGSMAMDRITKLDPNDPSYLQNRNDVIRQYPKAILDATANKFLDLQDDIYQKGASDRDFTKKQDDNRKFQLDIIDKHAENTAERDEARRARGYAEEVRQMSSEAQSVYFDGLDNGDSADESRARATLTHNRGEMENEFLRGGGSADDLQKRNDETGYFEPRTPRELAELTGSRKRDSDELRRQQTQITNLDDQNKLVQQRIDDISDQLQADSLQDLNQEDRAEVIGRLKKQLLDFQERSDDYVNRLAGLRGLGKVSPLGFSNEGSSVGTVRQAPGSLVPPTK